MRALALCVGVLAASEAWAVYACGDQVDSCQCGAPNPYPCCDNGGNCTWWAWEAACCHWGVGLPGWGNANQWVGNANANASYAVRSAPVVGAVSCRTLGTYGHVAYVEGLNAAGGVHVSEENCFGNYGKDYANYSSGFFQGFITRAGQVQCSPGDSQTQGCGNCGTQARGCGNDGRWGAWGACGAQGECKAGDTQEQACGTCGAQSRTCSSTCKWGAYPAACEGPDPDGGTLSCDTGVPGACAAGAVRCASGREQCIALTMPSAEVCDGVDNDCNGVIDDGCPTAVVTGPRPADQPPEAVKPARGSPVSGGCAAAPGTVLLAFALLTARRMSIRVPAARRA